MVKTACCILEKNLFYLVIMQWGSCYQVQIQTKLNPENTALNSPLLSKKKQKKHVQLIIASLLV